VFSLTAADYSKDNSYSFDGLLYAGPFSGNGGYLASQATGTQGTGTPLTSDSAGGITEINTALKWFYDNYRLSPDTIWCNSQEIQNISAKIIAGGAAPLFRFNLDATGNVAIIAGAVVGQYLNKFTGQLLKVRIHPYAVPGTILFTTKTLPYPQSGVNTVAQIKCRKEYYMIEWPLRTRKYEYGCYVDEVLQLQFLPGSARSRTSATDKQGSQGKPTGGRSTRPPVFTSQGGDHDPDAREGRRSHHARQGQLPPRQRRRHHRAA
jgi:hypothetical protein